MSRSSIGIPSPSDAVDGYKLALENAHRHIRCGQSLSQANEYGVATAHMVLAAEEAIKAMLLFVVSLGFELSSEALSPFLTQHEPRQIAGTVMIVMNFLIDFFSDKWFGSIASLNKEYPDATAPEYQSARRQKVEELKAELDRLENANPGENHFIDSIAWWGRSNDLKQRGLYVDFSEGAWRGPYSLTKEEFEMSLELAEEVVKIVEGLQTILSDNPDRREELTGLLSQFLEQRRAG